MQRWWHIGSGCAGRSTAWGLLIHTANGEWRTYNEMDKRRTRPKAKDRLQEHTRAANPIQTCSKAATP